MTTISDKKRPSKKSFFVLPLMAILAMSLALLVAIGYGEAYKSYSLLKIESVKALSEIVKKSVENFLNAGLPLKEYIGFTSLAKPITQSDPVIVDLSLVSNDRQVLFSTREEEARRSDNEAAFAKSRLGKKKDPFLIEESASLYKVLIPLRSKFEVDSVGYIQVFVQKAAIRQFVRMRFLSVLLAVPLIFGIFYLFISKVGSGARRKTMVNTGYTLAFFAMSAVVIWVLVGIYTEGIQGKTRALAQSLGTRLDAAFDLHLSLDDFGEMDRTFSEYRELNPEISYIELAEGNQILIHTDKARERQMVEMDNRFFHHFIDLTAGEGSKTLSLKVGVGILKKLVYQKVARSVKNFLVLFVASGFLAFLFLNLVTTVDQERLLRDDGNIPEWEKNQQLEALDRSIKLTMIRPVYFLGVFIEGMSASFLPQFFQGIAGMSAMGVDLAVSTLFTAFFIAYGVVLIPGGRFARRNGIKNLLVWAILFNAVAILAMSFTSNYYLMALLRVLIGAGQGLLLIGVQYFILEVVHRGNETQGNSIVVVEYCGGRLAGSAIGGLLATYIGFQGVFLSGGLLGLLALLYIWLVIPNIACVEGSAEAGSTEHEGTLARFKAIVRDPDFSLTTLLVGIHSKLVTTGVVIYALPLLMASHNYLQEDIGQILMFYSGGLLLTSNRLSRLVDRTKRTRWILLLGNLGSGLGLILIGAMGSKMIIGAGLPMLPTIVLIAGTLTLGIFHGFINAPVITHINNTSVTGIIGRNATTSLYRTIERVGQIFGPFAMSQLLLLYQGGPYAYTMMGLVTVLFGLVYLITFRGKSPARQPSEA